MPVAYKGMTRRIKDAVVTILGGIKYDPTGAGTNEPAFVSVLDNTKDDFEGYPAVRVLPNRLASATATNMERDHTPSLAIIVHWPLEDPANVESALFNQMYDITDLIVDAIEHGDYIGELSTLDAAIPSWMMNVRDARWTTGKGKAGALLLLSINIDISYSKDIT